MGHSSIRLKVRRKRVARLASISRKYTVNNCTIKVSSTEKKLLPDGETYDYSWEHKKYPQPKNLKRKNKSKKKQSEYRDYSKIQKTLWKNLSKEEKMNAYIEEKMKRWEKEFPCPVQTSDIQKDVFEQEYLPQWNEDYAQYKEHVTKQVTAMFNKVKLYGRFEISPHEYKDELIAELKDSANEGHNVNEIDITSKLVRKAQKIATCCWKKRKNMTCATLKSHDGKTGRVLIPTKNAA